MFLNELEIGASAEVTDIVDDRSIDKHRLSELGIVSGTKIKLLYTSPSGNPAAYLIRGTVFALRSDTSGKICVKAVQNQHIAKIKKTGDDMQYIT